MSKPIGTILYAGARSTNPSGLEEPFTPRADTHTICVARNVNDSLGPTLPAFFTERVADDRMLGANQF